MVANGHLAPTEVFISPDPIQTLFGLGDVVVQSLKPEVFTTIIPPTQNRSMNIVLWNCKGCNRGEFRRKFEDLLNWHKPPLVALIETKIQDHQVIVDDFPFIRMIRVPTLGNSDELVVLWDDNLLELEDIKTNAWGFTTWLRYAL
ncbi:hypothetical protein HAX54_047622 [Datura stramonium]|uniref:Endonuclease/exonuclease/phosphatase domain-containing protein n=1 Tax=Datura stramonium TaxID=4076 RepID=A0ABS8SUH6_DATST|nr:hypothetical protein [Datura stramonium]